MTDPLVLGGRANPRLLERLCQQLRVNPGRVAIAPFPDGELEIVLHDEVRGRDVYLLQPTRAPVGEHLLELALLADACRRAGSRRITALIPYYGYARQDRRPTGREPLGARLLAELVTASGIDRVVVMDLHSATVEGSFGLPLEHLSAVTLLAERARTAAPTVVVSPDMGAVKLAERYAKLLDLPVAVVHKHRLSGSQVAAQGVVGDVRGLSPLVIDDMISTGGTMAAAIETLLEQGCASNVTVAATHGLFVGPAVERLSKLPIQRIFTTDSVPPPEGLALPLEVVTVAGLFADAVRKLAAA